MLASWLVVAASGMSGGGMETASPSLGVSGASRLKFLCSYGGRILPRPSDGQLKYVGGDTRVVAVPRSVTFSELREKIASMFRAETVIKYQMASEDLDALVSVTCDEDLHHMLEEYDRLEANCSSCTHPRLRLFLFPIPTPAVTPTFEGSSIAGTPRHHPRPPHLQLAGTALEQRYIDAINGATTATRPPPGLPSPRGLTIVPPIRLSAFADSSAETSPTSTEAIGRDTSQGLASGGPRSPWRHSGGGDGGGGQALKDMHRARSSPNLQNGHWPQQQQQQQRLQALHGGVAVEYDAGVSAMGNAPRRHPPTPYPGTVYHSPVQTPRQQGVAGAFGGYADEVGRPEEG